MPISALPEDTTLSLGSSLAISTSVAVVKELVDSSIDAGATCIEVLISANTVDRIEVRDNGHGIPTQDFDSLCKRAHTSKLRCYEELKDVAGCSLGFRGEALAAMNTMGAVSITTRTDLDQTATTIRMQRDDGGIANRERTSAPVGTSVVVKGLFARMPVRERIAVREAQATLSTIKHTLFSYAFANPRLRLSLKVLKYPSLAWSYSPRTNAGARDAAMQILGPDLASQCQWKTTSSRGSATAEDAGSRIMNSDELAKQCLVIEALLPKSNTDICKKTSMGNYISVDRRPLSSKRGTAKKLLTIYRTHVGKMMRSDTIPKAPFLQLNIICPVGSYDPNIEPSKNDVLFADEAALLSLFEELCKTLYEDAGMETSDQAQLSLSASSKGKEAHELLPSTRQPSAMIADTAIDVDGRNPEGAAREAASTFNQEGGLKGGAQLQQESREPPMQRVGLFYHRRPVSQPGSSRDIPRSPGSHERRPCIVNMSAPVDSDSEGEVDDVGTPTQTPPLSGTEEVEAASTPGEAFAALNPWTIARMNAPHSPAPAPQNQALAREPSREIAPRQAVWQGSKDASLPPLRPTGFMSPGDLDTSLACGSGRPRHQLEVGRVSVPGGAYRKPLPSSRGRNIQSISRMTSPAPLGRVVGTQLNTPPSSIQRHRRGRHGHEATRQALQVDHEHMEQRGEDDGYRQTRLSLGGGVTNAGGRRQIVYEYEPDPGERNGGTGDDAPRSLARNRLATLTASGTARGAPILRERPARKNKSIYGQKVTSRPQLDRPDSPPLTDTRRSLPEDVEPLPTGLASGDPRCYLIRRQKSIAGEKPGGHPKKRRRLKTDMLPLETVPPGDQLQGIVQSAQLSTATISAARNTLSWFDGYLLTGTLGEGLDRSLGTAALEEIQSRVQQVLSVWAEKNGVGLGPGEAEMDLKNCMKGKQSV